MRTEANDPVILVVEDEPEVRTYLEMALRCEGYDVETAEDGDEALLCLEKGTPISAILLDVIMPKRDGLEILRKIRTTERYLPVIMISEAVSSGIVVEAMRAGANDFLGKPISHETLRRSLNTIFGAQQLDSLKPVAPSSPVVCFGSNHAMQELHRMLPQVAWSEAPVLIRGETGVGKEVLARHIHKNSRRAGKDFVKLNCAALPSELVESELFGYERGAFTGAFQRKPGMFEIADGGTLLLDEIGDMDYNLQAKLLQVLQDHEFQRLGGKETVRVDVRVIAATHNDLEKSITLGKFRQDLYYRLNVVSLYVPPLRERKEDISALTKVLLQKHSSEDTPPPEITAPLRQALLAHDWPGNVRELENIVRKLTVLRDPEMIARDLLAQGSAKRLAGVPVMENAPKNHTINEASPILEQVTRAKHRAETDAILAALNTTRWNRKRAATLLKIDYKALLYRMKKLGIDVEAPSSYDFVKTVQADGD